MTLLALEKMAESTPAHGIIFGGLGSLRTPPTEEQLYEVELARLAARQIAESFPSSSFERTSRDKRAFEIFKELRWKLRDYKGVSLPSFLGHDYAVVVKPRY